MLKRRDHVGSFDAYDEHGAAYTLDVYVDIIAAGTLVDPNAERRSLQPSILTGRGQPVNRLEKGRYQVVVTGEILVSDDPDAP